MAEAPLLCVDQLSIVHRGRTAERTIVDRISFTIGAERVALVGESGSGKSLTARALLGLLRPPLAVRAARLEFAGQDLRQCIEREWQVLRGSGIALVMQDPRHALNPVLSIGRQLDEAVALHQRLDRSERRRRVHAMLDAVGLADSDRLLRSRPHELSGGMGQRVMLAMMLISGPRLLIADEPTSALDAALRDQVLNLMSRLVQDRRMGLLLISHDLQQVARHCDRVLVIHRGRMVDARPASELATAEHPYTRALWSCRPSAATYGTRLPVIDWSADGAVPSEASPETRR
jgi:peptide/nickel transport system ATP-binding protein